ncbi:MAG: hypothetical protein KDA24_00390 [Deltaproteobacteria bacterium]|nr:hypothetical protein [Deltaproteobacteria bacterium]
MPITEIVRILARASFPGGTYELLYDVTGEMLPDEETLGWPAFWLRELDGDTVLQRVHGPWETEDEAIEWAEACGAVW